MLGAGSKERKYSDNNSRKAQGSRVQGVKSREQGARSAEQGAQSKVQRAEQNQESAAVMQ